MANRWADIEKRFLPKYVWDSDYLTFWRERILFIICIIALLAGPVVLVPSLILALFENRWDIVLLDSVAYITIAAILVSRNLPLNIRAWALCLMLYFLGIGLMFMIGPYGAGYIWLFASSVMVGAIIGFRESIRALLLNLLALLVVSVFIAAGLIDWFEGVENPLEKWLIITLNFLLINAFVTITTAVMLNALKNALSKEREIGLSLRQAQEELRESEKKYRLVFDSAGEGIVVIQDGIIRFINSRMLEMLDLDKSDIRPLRERSFLEWIHTDDRNMVADRYLKRMAGEPLPSTYSVRLLKENDNFFWVDISPVVIYWEGHPAMLAFITDVSDRVMAEEERKKLENQLQQAQKMEAVGTLAGGVAHDFNNLLQIINGYSQMLLMDTDEEDQHHSTLKEIEAAGARAAQLVQQLLLFSRKIESERQSVDLNQAIIHAIRLLERVIPKMIDIKAELDESLLIVNVDPVQIEQVLLNLGINAADAMPEGGELVYKTENMNLGGEHDRGHVEAPPGNYALLSVIDTGHGIDKETMEHIFEPFYTTKGIGKGTGLGLASAYGIIKGHGGDIVCRSEPDRGTSFEIYLPEDNKRFSRAARELNEALPRGNQEVLLIVDDEDSVRDFASRALKRFGYEVFSASSGEEAVAIFSNKHEVIDLVVLDIGMPGMGGSKCMLELLKISPPAKVIIASGYSKDGQVKTTLESGAAGFLGKPYKIQEMLQTIRSTLDN